VDTSKAATENISQVKIPLMSENNGSAYYLKPPTHNAELTEVRKGTPMGELMRRYWHPIAVSSDAADLPVAVRVLGEDLILFRDKGGNVGLLHPRCTHRGANLLYGRIDDCGLRCCYHGWAFDREGRCTDQPCEPNNGLRKETVRQPWYPVEERYGLIFAYLGPPDKKPLLPRYDIFENLVEGEQLFVDDHNIGSGRYFKGDVPFNWLQHFENILDYGHFLWLHYFHSGPQFGSRYGELDKLDFQPWERMAGSVIRETTKGVAADRHQTLPDGRGLHSMVETILPAVRGVPNPFGDPGRIDNLGFVLPVDDTNFRIFNVLKGREDTFFRRLRETRNANAEKAAKDPFYAQRYPGDWEAQGSQGPIALHSEENLRVSDRGVATLRRVFKRQLAAVQAGKDPIGVAFELGKELVVLEAGQFLSNPGVKND
jgi:phenylpropionate dioxygenase-like ring-hydroxylating dioxygenase large terminal subunit